MTTVVKNLLNELYNTYHKCVPCHRCVVRVFLVAIIMVHVLFNLLQLRLVWWKLLIVKMMILSELLALTLDILRMFVFRIKAKKQHLKWKNTYLT